MVNLEYHSIIKIPAQVSKGNEKISSSIKIAHTLIILLRNNFDI
jgi:hypothetical protein